MLPATFGQSLYNLQGLDLRDNELTVLPGTFGQGMPNLRTLYLSGNQLIALPASFGLPLIFNRLQTLDLRHNNLTQLPDYLGLGMDLPFSSTRPGYRTHRLHLGNNPWDVSATPVCCSFAVMNAWTSTELDEPGGECKKNDAGDLETCPLADGRCPIGSSWHAKSCAACEEDPSLMSGSDKDLFMIMVMFGPWGAYALLVCGTKRKVNKTVRQLAVSGADVEVRFGLCQAGAEPALALRTDLIAHLGCEEEKVQVEDFSTALAAGVRVVVHSEGEHSGAHGAVVKKTGEEVGAATSTVGAEIVY